MKALEYLLSQPLLCTQEAADAAWAIVNREGDPQALQGRKGTPMDGTRTVDRRGGVAVVPVTGPIFRYADLMTDLCGGTTTQALAKDITSCLDDPTCTGIVLDFDTPGGEAAGIGELAAMIRSGTKSKPIVAYVGNSAASGGCWLASACERVVMAPAASMGCIGVVMGYSERSPRAGEKRYEFVSSQSPDKRPNLDSEAGKAVIQARVNDLADVFVDAVASYRGVDRAKVISDFGKGSVLIASKAIEVGMADSLGSLEGLISELQTCSVSDGMRTPDRASLGSSALTGKVSLMNPFNVFAKLWDKDPHAVEAAMKEAGETLPIAIEAKTAHVVAPLSIPAVADAPEFKALAAQLADLKASNASLQSKAVQADAERVEAMASVFLGSVTDRVFPAEMSFLKGEFIQAAQDDAERPLSSGSRVQTLRDRTSARPKHGLFSSQVSGQSLPPNVLVMGQHAGTIDPEAPGTNDEINELLALDPRGRTMLRQAANGK